MPSAPERPASPPPTDPDELARAARDKIAAARVWLLRDKPFFGVLARALRVEPSRAVAGMRLHPDDRLELHPDVVLAARFPAVCARLAHASLHAALGALVRRREREPRRWNLAHDLAVAPLLAAARLGVGPTSRAPAPLALEPGASAEAYYELLPSDGAPDDAWCDLCDPPGAEGARTAAPEAACVGSDARARELGWRLRLAAAFEEELASGGKSFGDRPAWVDELVRASLEPPQHWSAELQRSLGALARVGRSWLRPSRRTSALFDPAQGWPELVTMPGRRVDPGGRLVVVLDTSGSVTTAELARFLGVVASVACAEGIDEVRLVQCDAVVASDEVLDTASLGVAPVAVHGRGGTDYRPALELLAREAERGEHFTVIYLTDLAGRFPDEAAPALEVLWVVPRRAAGAAPFGRVVVMGDRA
ncbi:MAG: hypothetical protein IT373_26170 [Polyangiaceae bacterium]|nr:hypothetical protein [Polyangiaceae bacterium]